VQVVAGAAAWAVPGVLPDPWTKFAGARTVGTLGTVGAYSIVLGVCIALATDRAARLAGWARLVSAATAVAGGLFVILTFSRGSWLAMVPLLTSILAIHRRAAATVLIPFLLAGALLGSTVLADAATYATDRINSEETATSRVVVYAAAVRMLVERPILGWGYDRFNDYVDRFRERFGEVPVNVEITSHNAYLTIGAELGAIAMLLYLGAIAFWLLKTIRIGRRLPNVAPVPRQLVILLWGAVGFSFIVSNFIDTIRYNELSTVFVWLALGLIATAVTTASNRAPALRQPDERRAE
jgi:O-antigen ligase